MIAARQKSGNRQVFVDLLPTEAYSAPGDFTARALLGSRRVQNGKPDERHAQGATVGEYDLHGLFVKCDRLRERRRRNVRPSRPGVILRRNAHTSLLKKKNRYRQILMTVGMAPVRDPRCS